MDESILTSIKLMIGIEEDDDSFDVDVIGFINAAFALLKRVGAGPKEGFIITDESTTWKEFSEDKVVFALAKIYVYQHAKLKFDPSSLSSAVIESINNSNAEIEWTLNTHIEIEG